MFTMRSIVVGDWRANCYALESAGETLVIDPGDEPERLIAWLGDVDLKKIVLTHCHCDHIGAVNELVEKFGCEVLIGRDDVVGLTNLTYSGFDDEGRDYKVHHVDRALVSGDTVSWGDTTFEVIGTPGHTPGSICLYDAESAVLMSGDTLFPNGIGRTDFVRGNAGDMRRSCARLGMLPDDVVVYPGHGPETIMGIEKKRNRLLVPRGR